MIYSDEKVDYLLSMLLNVSIIHSHLPSECMFTLIIPILKDKKCDVTSKDNYRPIALTSIISKVLEIVILSRYCDHLASADNQFGY